MIAIELVHFRKILTLSKYNAHTESLFNQLNLLKVVDIHKLQQLKFYYRYLKNDLPEYFTCLNYIPHSIHHDYNTRYRHNLCNSLIKHTFAMKCIRYSIPLLINESPPLIIGKFSTHSLTGFSSYTKHYYISKYNVTCIQPNCYICNRNP